MKSLQISKKLFVETSGLHDSRNKKSEVDEAISGWFDANGYIFYHRSFTLIDELYKSGRFWMWSAESYPKRLLDHIDDWIENDLITFDYK